MHVEHRARIFFFFALLSLFIVFIVMSFVGKIFEDTFSDVDTAENVTNVAADGNTDIPYDPLVTVVPQEVLGGKPQPLSSDPKRGATNPRVTIVEFGDFECPDCATMSLVMDSIVEEYEDVALHVWKDFPLPNTHAYSEEAAMAARCAQEQNAFWEYHDTLFEQYDQLAVRPWLSIADDLSLDREAFQSCLTDSNPKQLVTQGYFIARTLQIDTTPSYFIDDELIVGAKTVEEMREIINRHLQEAEKVSGSEE